METYSSSHKMTCPQYSNAILVILLCIQFLRHWMPIKMSKKGGGTKKRSFDDMYFDKDNLKYTIGIN